MRDKHPAGPPTQPFDRPARSEQPTQETLAVDADVGIHDDPTVETTLPDLVRDTIQDVRSPFAKPALQRPSSEPRMPPAAPPRPPSSPATPAAKLVRPTFDGQPVSAMPTLDAVVAERDKALKMVSVREGILQVVAHDLRNPLNLVKVGGSLLTRMVRASATESAEPIDADKVSQVADTLLIAVRRMERLITDLLDLEALDKGQLRLVRGPANANTIVDEVVVEMAAKASEKGVEVAADKPRHTVIIDCDKDRIAQILENLVGNAIRFTPSGKRIVVRLKEAQGEARFEVADEGPGIADADLPRIFDPYYRAQVPQGRGLGLGLSIALGLVRAHDGAIWAESAEGHGATFVFTMPRREFKRDTMVNMPAIQLPPIPRKR